MSKKRLYTAIIGATLLAIPTLNFISALVVFPLAVYALFAIVTNFAPILIVGAKSLGMNSSKLLENWKYFGILWIGCAFGLSRWGDAGASMGGENVPYLKIFFAPWLMLFGVPVW